MRPTTALGSPVPRREGREKVTGAARYAAEHTPRGCAYAWPVPAAIARGRVVAAHILDRRYASTTGCPLRVLYAYATVTTVMP